MAAEVEERGPIPNLALNAILIPVLEETALVIYGIYICIFVLYVFVQCHGSKRVPNLSVNAFN